MNEINLLKTVKLYGSVNVMDIILCRGAGLCDLTESDIVNTWNETKVCENHIKELTSEWEHRRSKHALVRIHQGSQKDVCSLPTKIGFKHDVRPVASGKNIQHVTKSETQMILQRYNVFVPQGTLICHDHKQFLQQKLQAENVETHRRVEEIEIDENVCIDEPMEIDSEPCSATNSNECTVLQKGLRQFAKLANIPRVNSAKSFSSLSQSTKNKKVCTAKKLIDVILSIMAADEKDELKRRVFQDSSDMWSRKNYDKLGDLLEYVAEAFRKASNRAERYTILSMIASTIPLSQVRVYIPGLSYHVYNMARQYKRFKLEEKRKLERNNPEGTNLFIEYITSNIVMSPYTFGTLKTKTSSGTIVELPKTIRKLSASEIIYTYIKMLEETGQQKYIMSNSTYFRILNVCSAVNQRASGCVDYYVADGTEAVDDMTSILSQWNQKGMMDVMTYKRIVKDLEDALHYLLSDYRLHVKKQSRIPDHCGQYALSNPSDSRLSQPCNHLHDLSCDRCEHVETTLIEINETVKSFIRDTQEQFQLNQTSLLRIALDDLYSDQEDLEEAFSKIRELKKHLLRAKITDDERSTVVKNLNRNEALITLDYAQKLLPQKFNEKQCEYFGKRGLSWHVSHVIANISYHVVTHSFVHLLDNDKQDTESVSSIIQHVLKELHVMGIRKVFLRSDNAGAYHSAQTIGTLPQISNATSVEIARYFFSEVQNGKSHCDRIASVVKRKIHSYVDAGNDIVGVEDFFKGVTSKKPLKGISVYRGRIERPTQSSKEKTKIQMITNYFEFVFSNDTLIMHHYNRIGLGVMLSTADFWPNKSRFILEESGGFLPAQGLQEKENEKIEKGEITEFWYTTQCVTAVCRDEKSEFENILSEEDQISSRNVDDDAYFRCSTPGCSASFRHFVNLEKHAIMGKHNKAPEKLTLMDYSLQKYLEQLEEVANTKGVVPELDDALRALQVASGNKTLLEGWALKEKKMSGRFSNLVRTYLTNTFIEGDNKGRKYTGDEVVKKMKTEKNPDGTRMFVKLDKVSAKQVNSFFSRLNSDRQSNSNTRSIRSSDVEMKSESSSDGETGDEDDNDNENDEDEDEYSEEYILIGFKDPFYSTSLDIEIRKEVRKSQTIFRPYDEGIDADPDDVDSPLLEKSKKPKN